MSIVFELNKSNDEVSGCTFLIFLSLYEINISDIDVNMRHKDAFSKKEY